MYNARHFIGALALSISSLLALASNAAQPNIMRNLDTIKTSLTTLGTDLNKIGQGLAANADMTAIGIKLCEIGKSISALGASAKFSDDLDAAIAAGSHPLAKSLSDLSMLTGNLSLPAAAPALNLMNLKALKLDKLAADLGTIVTTDLADTSKTDVSSLQKDFSALGTHLKEAGLNAAGSALADIAKTDEASQAITTTNQSNSYFNLWSGAVLENPYAVSLDPTAKSPTATLQPTKSTADGFLELNFNYAYVLRQGTDKQQDPFIWPANRAKHGVSDDSPSGAFVAPWIHFPDFNSSVGYVFRGSTAPTNFSSSTIAGGSDLYAMGTLGFPWWRYADKTGAIRKMQSTLDISGGVVTDKDHLLIHPNIFVGGGFQGAYSLGGANSSLLGLWSGRIGLARVDRPRLTTGSNVALNSLNEPEFDATWAPSMGFNIIVPVTGALSAKFGGNVYFVNAPASWNVSLGVQVALDKFFGALK